MNYHEILHIYYLQKTCTSPELMELLNDWRAIKNVLITRKIKNEHNIEFEVSPGCTDFTKYNDYSDADLNKKADLLFRIINQKHYDNRNK